MPLHLLIGNKNYSSWSFRPWIAMKVAGIPFTEEVISLDAKDFKARVTKISGSGKVPALLDGEVRVWESLAILDYLAETFPDAKLWPAERAARAHARAVAAEMHAGFMALRNECAMNMWRPVIPRELTPAAAANVRRIEPSGRIAVRVSAPAARSCSAALARPMPCMRRSSHASTPMPRPWAPSRAPTWMR